MNQVHASPSHFLKIHFNIILSYLGLGPPKLVRYLINKIFFLRMHPVVITYSVTQGDQKVPVHLMIVL